MKCKRLFALLLSLCMVASTIIAVPVSAATKTEILAQAGSDFSAEEPNLKVTVFENVAEVKTSYAQKDGKDVLKIEVSNVKETTGNKFLIGFQINDAKGNAVPSFAKDTTFDYDMNFMIETADGSDPVDQSGSRGLWIRGGVWDTSGNFPGGTGDVIRYVSPGNKYAPNTWVSWSGEYTLTKDYADQGKTGGGVQRPYNFFLRPDVKSDCVIYIDNMNLLLTKEVEVVDQLVGYLPQGETTQNGKLNYTFENGTFTVNVAELKKFSNGQNLSGNCFLRFIPAEPISNNKKFKVAFDLETSGLKTKDGADYTELDAGVRLFNTADGTTNANTVRWLKHNVKANSGVVAVEYINPDDKTSEGSVPTEDIESIGISVNVQNSLVSSADDAYIKISNVRIEDVVDEEPVEPEEPEERFDVIDIDLPLDDKSEFTWVQSGVTVSNADDIGGRSKVVYAEGLANGNNNTVGVKLPDGFAFKEGDVLTYSVDVYSEKDVNPYMALRNHGTSLNPYVQLFEEKIETGKWVTITKSYTFAELEAKIPGSNSSGTFAKSDNYAFYMRPNQNANVYLDNFKLTVSRIGQEEHIHNWSNWTKDGDENHKKTCSGCSEVLTEAHGWDTGVVTKEPTYTTEGEKKVTCTGCGATKTEAVEMLRGNVINIDAKLDTVSELTWIGSDAVTVSTVNGVGGRDDVIKVEGLGNSHLNSVGVKLPDGFAFEKSDIITYSVDVYADSAINPDIWLRNHNGSVLTPFIQLYNPDYNTKLTVNTWTTITKTVTFKDLGTTYDWTTEGNYAIYLRPRQDAGKVYLDNFTVTVSRPGYQENHEHNWGDWTYVDDTNHQKTCSGCIEVLTEAHTWNEGTVITAPTYTTEGEKKVTCSGCGTTKTVAIEKLRGNVIDVKVDDESDFTWHPSAVTISKKDGIGGKNGVFELVGFGNSDDKAVGIVLGESFAFEKDDILTYSFEIYSSSTVKPNVYLRNKGSSYNPLAVFEHNKLTANTWTTVTKTLTYAEIEDTVIKSNSSGAFTTPGKYALYIRPNSDATAYVANFTVTISRPGYVVGHEHSYTTYEKVDAENHNKVCSTCGNKAEEAHAWNGGVVAAKAIYETTVTKTYTCTLCGETKSETLENIVVGFTANNASDITWKGDSSVTATDVDNIGGRNSVIALGNLKNTPTNTAGVVLLGDYFAFMPGDTLTYSFDVYSEKAINPDMWLRDKADNNPYKVFYRGAIEANTWTTVTNTVTYEDWTASAEVKDGWDVPGKFALYLRPRTPGDAVATVYIDNFTVTVSREDTNIVTFGTKSFLPNVTAEAPETVKNERVKHTVADGTFDVDFKELATYSNGQNLGLNSFIRVIPTIPLDYSRNFKITFDVTTSGLDVESISGGARLFSTLNGTISKDTIGRLDKTGIEVNKTSTVSVTRNDFVALGSASGDDGVASFGIYLDVQAAADSEGTAEDAHLQISNIKVEYIDEPIHVCEFGDWEKVDDEYHKKSCECGKSKTEGHTWDDGVVTQEPTTEAEGVKTYTCSVCKGTKTETIDKLVAPMVITVGNATAKVGEEVTVSVTLEKNTCMAALQLRINYDEALTFVRATNKVSYDEYGYTYQKPGDTSANSEGYYIWDGENTNLNGEILQLTFAIPEGTDIGDYEIKIADIIASTWVGNETPELAVTTVDGKITATPNFIAGDVNENGVFDTADIIATRRFITGGWGITINTVRADVDADEKHTAKDVILMRRALAGGYNVTLK